MTAAVQQVEPAAARPQVQSSYVTFWIGDQLFGISIARAHDVFALSRITPVPLAPPEVRGLINLRGRVVTAFDMRCRLDLPHQPIGAGTMAIGLELGSDGYALVVDRIGEIVWVEPNALYETPIHLDPRWAELAQGVHRLETGILIILDVDALLAIDPKLPNKKEMSQ